ncbi:MAG: hypothetical protein ACRET6_09180 [Burkholderiales bacterium]
MPCSAGSGRSRGTRRSLALALGTVAAASTLFGGASRYIQVISYSTTVLFHMIPGFTETLTRLPRGAPLAGSPEAPILQGIFAVLFAIFLIGLTLQIRWLRSTLKSRS